MMDHATLSSPQHQEETLMQRRNFICQTGGLAVASAIGLWTGGSAVWAARGSVCQST
mgnify:FL=1